jgi:ABC-type glycerol-3-phosphate transport system substrate-binding protein
VKKVSLILALVASLSMSGCSSTGANAFSLTTNTALTWNVALGAAVAIYLIYDPLAPNWEIEEAKLNDESYRFSMKMKRFHTGGAGESLQILKRRAAQLQQENGHAAYQIIEYTEGIDSQTLGARRVAQGMIRFVKRGEADSLVQNAVY